MEHLVTVHTRLGPQLRRTLTQRSSNVLPHRLSARGCRLPTHNLRDGTSAALAEGVGRGVGATAGLVQVVTLVNALP